jgi:hypothetical protein
MFVPEKKEKRKICPAISEFMSVLATGFATAGERPIKTFTLVSQVAIKPTLARVYICPPL